MAYLGNNPTQQAFQPAIDYFSGNGATSSFTLSRPVASVAQVQVVVNNVQQNPSSFTVSGNTLTLGGAPSAGTNNIYVTYTSPITQIIQPGQGTVGTSQMMDAAVTAAKIASGQVLPAAGIAFPDTQSASSDANTLDDYEEGTFTPTFSTVTVGNGALYGYYTKTGNIVSISFGLIFGSTTSIGGVVNGVGGLPFTAKNINANAFQNISGNAWKVGTGWTGLFAGLINNANNYSYPLTTSTLATITSTTPYSWASGDSLNFTGTYTV